MHHLCSNWSNQKPINYSKSPDFRKIWISKDLIELLKKKEDFFYFNPELQCNPHVSCGGRFLHVHWNGKDDWRILAKLHACQTNRPRRRLSCVRLGLLWWKRFQVSLRFLSVFFNNINQSTESTRIPKCPPPKNPPKTV